MGHKGEWYKSGIQVEQVTSISVTVIQEQTTHSRYTSPDIHYAPWGTLWSTAPGYFLRLSSRCPTAFRVPQVNTLGASTVCQQYDFITDPLTLAVCAQCEPFLICKENRVSVVNFPILIKCQHSIVYCYYVIDRTAKLVGSWENTSKNNTTYNN